ncbi:MAG: hypothetical protein ACR2KB_12585, partial [Chitinophagaceae bacterium]
MFKKILLGSFFTICLSVLFAQSPGLIVRPATGHVSTILNPTDPLAYASATNAGFVNDDIAESKIPFTIVPPMIIEPTGDVATGPNGGFTDIVQTVDGSGFYIAKVGTNLLFRLRIGKIISGAKGYSVLIDTDGRMGNSGPAADPTYAAPTNSSNGNPGFEYEVVFRTGHAVTVYNVDNGSPVWVKDYPLSSHSQISVALTTDGNDADYFYDWFVELADIGNPTQIRLAATTVTSPTSALQGSRSDIYGIDDRNYASPSSAWEIFIKNQPQINISGTSIVVGATCTPAPVLNSPITIGNNINVTGSWTRLDETKSNTATITLYKNGVNIGTTTATSGIDWSISVGSIATNNVFYAMAQAAGESLCLQSNYISAGCSTIPAAPVISSSSSKGICGSMPIGSKVLIYQLNSGSATPVLLNSNDLNTTYPTTTTFQYFNCSGGSGNVTNGTYMIVTILNGCTSLPVYECVSNGSSTATPLVVNSISVPTLYPFHTSFTGTGATTGELLRLFINGIFINSLTASSTSFTFTGLSLKSGDIVRVMSHPASGCATLAAAVTVSCYTAPPSITTGSDGKLIVSATSVSGTSLYPGATVSLFKGTNTAVGTPATVSYSGTWSINVTGLTTSDVIYATQTFNSCTSAASVTAGVNSAATVCPSLTGSYTENNTSASGTLSSSFTGTVRLYIDDVLIGSTNVTTSTTWTISSFTSPLYAGGLLVVKSQASGQAESTNACAGSTATVTCTVPLTPSVTPSDQTIQFGQST